MKEIHILDLFDCSGGSLFCVFIMNKSRFMFTYECVGQLGDEWIIRISDAPIWELVTVSHHANDMQAGSVYLVRAESEMGAIEKIPLDDKIGDEQF